MIQVGRASRPARSRLAQHRLDIPELVHALMDLEPTIDSGSDLQQTLGYLVQRAPSFSLRGGTREVLRGIIARGLGLR